MVPEGVAVDLIQVRVLHPGSQAIQVFLPADVEIQERRAEHPAIPADRGDCLPEGGNGQGGHRVGAGPGHGLPDRGVDLFTGCLHIQLRPARFGRAEIIFRVSQGKQAPVGGKHGRLATGGADIQSQQTYIVQSPVTGGRRVLPGAGRRTYGYSTTSISSA